MLNREELFQSAETALISPDRAQHLAEQVRRQNFSKYPVIQGVSAAIGVLITLAILIGGFITVISFPSDVVRAFGGGIGALAGASSIFIGYQTYQASQFLLLKAWRKQYAQHCLMHPLETTVEIETVLTQDKTQATLTTTAYRSKRQYVLETLSLDMTDDASLKTVAACRVRNEQCQSIINDWIDGTIASLPTQPSQQTLVASKQADERVALAHDILMSDQLDTRNRRCLKKRVGDVDS